MKKALEALTTIGIVDVTRSDANYVGGYTWTVSFIENVIRLHQGDLPNFGFTSALISDSGLLPSASFAEVRKGCHLSVSQK